MLRTKAAAALQELLTGNQRFVSDRALHADDSSERRVAVAAKQEPLAVIVGCADSRESPELIFDQGLGRLFVIRTAGHVLDNVDVGTVQYATDLLHVPLVLVVGHTGCGAVTAAVIGEQVRGHLADLLVVLSERALAVAGVPGDPIENAMRENVRQTVSQLRSSALMVNSPADTPQPEILGACYDLVTGVVEILP
jgi:carbonic anhydrase